MYGTKEPEDAHMKLHVSMDVTSLYTNIPHNDGIEACREAWDQRAVKEPPTDETRKVACEVQIV
jgi:hypothetical protein